MGDVSSGGNAIKIEGTYLYDFLDQNKLVLLVRKLPNGFWQAYIEHSFEVNSSTSLSVSSGAGETPEIAISAYVKIIKGKEIVILFKDTLTGVVSIPESEAKKYRVPDEMYV